MSGMKPSCQNLILSETGFKNLSIGDLIAPKGHYQFKQLDSYPDKNRIRIGFEDYYNYYFFPGNIQLIINPDTIKISHFFLATDKKGIIEGLTIFLDSSKTKIIANKLDLLYGPQKLQSTSGANGQTERLTMFWTNNLNAVFITKSFQRDIKIDITGNKLTGFRPMISLNY